MRGEIDSHSDFESKSLADSTQPHLSRVERALLDAVSGTVRTAAELFCPNCEARYRTGELACPHCGLRFAPVSGAKAAHDTPESLAPKPTPLGAAFIQEQRPLVFEIDRSPVSLPLRASVIVGRLSPVPDDPYPDVNLNAFDARAQGVSRQHAKLTRVRDLIYVMDMASTNGTYLNGRRLTPKCPRILRNGDDLQLGHLKVRVRF